MIVDKTEGAHPSRVTDEAPPSYTASPSSSRSHPSSFIRDLPQNIEATNLVQIIRKEGSVKGTWIIDPTLVVPAALLPPLPDGASESDRKNVHLQSKEGSVCGDIYIKPTSYNVLSTMKTGPKVTIYAMSKEGTVELKVHDPPINMNSDKRPPISIQAQAKEGDVRIYLPRSFCGPFRVTTKSSKKSSLVLSPGVQSQLPTFSENLKVKQGFIGRPDGPDGMEGALNISDWSGDVLEAEIFDSSSHVELYFNDEDEKKSHNFCLFRKLFPF